MNVLVQFYMKNYALAEYLIVQDIQPLQCLSEFICVLIL